MGLHEDKRTLAVGEVREPLFMFITLYGVSGGKDLGGGNEIKILTTSSTLIVTCTVPEPFCSTTSAWNIPAGHANHSKDGNEGVKVQAEPPQQRRIRMCRQRNSAR